MLVLLQGTLDDLGMMQNEGMLSVQQRMQPGAGYPQQGGGGHPQGQMNIGRQQHPQRK